MMQKICSIKECNNPNFSRTWCVAHYKKWYKYGDPLVVRLGTQEFKDNVSKALKKSWADGKYKNRKTVIPAGWNKGIPVSNEVKQKISNTLKQYNFTDEHRRNISKGQTGKLKSVVGYSRLHAWIRETLGYPDTCKQCGKTGLNNRQAHWANISHEYKRDVNDFIRLCVKCHSLYDHGKIKLGVTK